MKHLYTSFLAVSAIFFTTQAWGADIENVRIKPDSNKTELIFDLSSTPIDLTVSGEASRQLQVVFSGHLSQTQYAALQKLPQRDNLKSVTIKPLGSQVQIAVNRAQDANWNVYTLDNPSRLVIRVDETPKQEPINETLAPGLTHQHLVRQSPQGPLNIHVLTLNPKQGNLTLEPVLASQSIHGKAKVRDLVNRSDALAGVNAAFFKPDTGTNLGTTIINRELMAGPLYNRVCFGITANNQFKMDRLSLGGGLTLANGQVIPIHNINQPRLSKHEFILYSSYWGWTAPNTPIDGIQIQVNRNQITAISDTPLSIPPEGYVLIGPKSALSTLPEVDSLVNMNVYTQPDWSDMAHVISGGPYLVKNGQVYVDLTEQSFRDGSFTKPAPRTAIGITANQNVILVTVDGRQKQVSVGVTLSEMARIMKSLGAVEAMNLDGGSSTQMVINGQVVNLPTVPGGAMVSSSLLIRAKETLPDKPLIGER